MNCKMSVKHKQDKHTQTQSQAGALQKKKKF